MPDLLLSAAFDDQTEEFFARLQQNLNALPQQADTALGGMGRQAGDAAAQIGLIAGAVGGITSKLIEMGMQAAQSIPALIAESTKLAAASQSNSIALGVVAQNAGYSAAQVQEYKDQLVQMGIAESTATQYLLKLAGAQIDLADATKLANTALDLATIANTSEEEALMRATHAIVTKNTMMLGDMQIMFRADEAYAAYAQSLGKSVTELTAVEEKQAFFNATLEQGEKLAGARTATLGTAAKQSQLLGEQVENNKRAFGELFLPAYTEWLKAMAEGMAELGQWFANNSGLVKDVGQSLGMLVKWLIDGGRATLEFLGKFTAIGSIVSNVNSYLEQFDTGMRVVWVAKEILEEVYNGFAAVIAPIIAAGKAVADFAMQINPVFALLKALPDLVTGAGVGLAGLFIGQEEAAARFENFGEIVKQTLVVIGAKLAESVVLFQGLGQALGQVISGAWQAITGQSDAAQATFNAIPQQLAATLDQAAAASTAKAKEMMEAMKMMPAAVADSTNQAAKEVEAVVPNLEEAAQKIADLNQKMAEEMARVAKQRMRQDIDAAIAESRQREDLERNHQKRLDQIARDTEKRREKFEQGQAKARLKLDQDMAQRRVDAEIQYQRRLEDIREDFVYQADELARKNDAVGLTRLIRENERRLVEEEQARERQAADRQLDYSRRAEELRASQEEERAEFEADLQERLQQAEEQRAQDIENLNRSLERQREDKARHRAWEDEDRAEANAKSLAEMGDHFGQVEGLTSAHLQTLVDENGQAITQIEQMWAAYYARSQQREAIRYQNRFNPRTGGDVTYSDQNQDLQSWFGQGGGSTGWGFAQGGMGIVTRPTSMTVGERGPEAFAALPMSGTVRHVLSGNASLDVNGLSNESRDRIEPLLYDILTAMFLKAAGG